MRASRLAAVLWVEEKMLHNLGRNTVTVRRLNDRAEFHNSVLG